MVAKANNPIQKKKNIALFVFFFFKSIHGEDDCRPASCGPTEPQVRFPFRLQDRQPAQCGFRGFELSCDKNNRTLLKLPSSQSFNVKQISYTDQVISIDPDFCRPERIADIRLTNTPFDFSITESYTFFNCLLQNPRFKLPTVPFPCLRSANRSVFAVRTGWLSLGEIPASCKRTTTISVPVKPYGDFRKELTLMWFRPSCRSCEAHGGTCGLRSDDGETACFGSSHGISKSAKYGLSFGLGVPGLICIMGILCCCCKRPTTTGLNQPTIESYPKTLWGENRNLLNKDDMCAICLSDYEPREAIITIPKCKHYFHAECVDKWLKLKATCPMCRSRSSRRVAR